MNKQYRLLPVELSPAIKDAIVASGHFMPESLWASVIAAHDLVAGQPEQAPVQSVPDGWKIVPEKCTFEMRMAWDCASSGEDDDIHFGNAYHDMLAAAPTPPVAPADKLTECRHCGFYVALNRAPADAPAAPTLTDSDSERELFEKEYPNFDHSRNMPDGSYNSPTLYQRWIGWQAGRAERSEEKLTDADIDDMAFGYCPDAPIGQLREFARAIAAHLARKG